MNSKFALITFLDGPPSVGGGSPDNSLPTPPVYPSQGLPGGGHISTLPVYPFDPTIDNSLPGAPPHVSTGPIVPGRKFIVKWLACVGLILVPDNELPPTPEPK
jgi:hypothetical protein